MKHITRTAMFVILASSGWISLHAQDPAVIRVNTDLVTVNVSVSDRKNRPLTGLGAGDFVVTEDGKPVSLDFFSGSGPASIVIVLDISSSMEPKTPALRKAFKRFLTGAHADNDYTLITFNASPRLIASSMNSNALWQEVSHLDTFGETALYDAILLGLDALEKTPQRHRALVVLSDGDDNRSRATLAEVGEAVSARHATVYTIGILAGTKWANEFDRRSRELLLQLAEVTGGIVRLSKPEDLAKALIDISYDLRNQYCLGYYAPEGTPGWRHLQVSLVSSERSHNLRHKQKYLTK